MRTVSKTILILLSVAASAVFGQAISGSISGRVVDQQGASVPNVTLTAVDPTKNINVQTRTNEQGDFQFPGLQPGTYNITVEAAGFKKMQRTGVALDANDKLSLGNVALEVGTLSESVEVAAQTALLQTESVERGASVIGKQIENIEVNGRNPLDLAKLVPGVVSTANFSTGGVGGLSGLFVNGSRGTENQLTINGVSDIDTGANGSQNVTVSMDSMAEFKILTGMYQAEYGRNAGAQISLVTKSGSNQFHGSGYWYHRNDSLNANLFTNNARPGANLPFLPRNLFRFNDPGYTIGGPVALPKLKDKFFFFWSQEYQRQLQPNAAQNKTLPTALERTGDFSKSVDNNHNPITIIDPTTGKAFPGNIIPANRIYAPGQAILKLYPLPNADATGYNYTSQFSSRLPRREDLLRLDYNMSSNVRFFGHWINNVFPQELPYGSFVLGPTVPLTKIVDTRPGHSIAAGMTWVINPTMTNEANWGFTKNKIDIFEDGTVLRRKTSGITLPLLYPNALQDDYIPNLTFGGTHLANSPTFVTNDAPFKNYNTSIDISDNLSKLWGSHAIKIGGFIQRSRKDQTSFGDNNGAYNFGDVAAGTNPYDTGYGYSNALLGVYQTMDQASAYINGQYRYYNIEGYVQDTWKITKRLTLDYGLRLSWYQPQFDSSQQASTFVLSAWNPAKAPRLYQPAIINGVRSAFDPATQQTLPAYAIGLEVPGSGDPFNGVLQAGKGVNKYLQENRGIQWGPRFGVAWDITGKQNLVLRTGGGIYYDRFQGNRVFDFVRNPPETVQPLLNYGYAQDINPSNILLGPPTLYAADPAAKIPTTYNYQFGIQARLPWSFALDTAYVGSVAKHLQDNRNLNPIPYGATFLAQNQDPTKTSPPSLPGANALPDAFLRPLRGFGQINLYESAAFSNYNAFQMALNRRAARGLFFGFTYTVSKALTNATSDTTVVRFDSLSRAADYGPANFDRRQVLSSNFVYTLPGMKAGNAFTKLATNGWQVTGVILATTGAPFTPGFSVSGAGSSNITGNSLANATYEGARIGVKPGCDPYTHSGDPYNRLNANCFFAPSPGSLGLESGINWLYAPGLFNLDLSVQKEFAVKERVRFQLRVDAFNAPNHPNFTGINSTLNFTSYQTGAAIANNATGYNATGQFVNPTGFGTASNPAAGALGSARILQTLIRIQF